MKILQGDPKEFELGNSITLSIDIEEDVQEVKKGAVGAVRGKYAEVVACYELQRIIEESDSFLSVELLEEQTLDQKHSSYLSMRDQSPEEDKKEWELASEGGKVQAKHIYDLLKKVKDKQICRVSILHSGEKDAKGSSGNRGDVSITLTPISEEQVETVLELSLKNTANSTTIPQTSVGGLYGFVTYGKDKEKDEVKIGANTTFKDVISQFKQGEQKYPPFKRYYRTAIEVYTAMESKWNEASKLRQADLEQLKKKHPNLKDTTGHQSKEAPERGVYYLPTMTKYLDKVYGSKGAKLALQVRMRDALYEDLQDWFSDLSVRESFILHRLGVSMKPLQEEQRNILKLAIASDLKYDAVGSPQIKVSDTYNPSSAFYQTINKWIEGVDITFDKGKTGTGTTEIRILIEGKEFFTLNGQPTYAGKLDSKNAFPLIKFQPFISKDISVNENLLLKALLR